MFLFVMGTSRVAYPQDFPSLLIDIPTNNGDSHDGHDDCCNHSHTEESFILRSYIPDDYMPFAYCPYHTNQQLDQLTGKCPVLGCNYVYDVDNGAVGTDDIPAGDALWISYLCILSYLLLNNKKHLKNRLTKSFFVLLRLENQKDK